MNAEGRVLDTNIVSYLMRGDTRAAAYRRHVEGRVLAVSFMTVGELYEGAYRAAWTQDKLGTLMAEIQKYAVIPPSRLVCETYGRIRAERRHQPIAVDDGWIAATAVAKGCPLVTNNPDHFRGISGLEVISEYRA